MSPCTNSTPPAWSRGTFSSEPRRFRLSSASTRRATSYRFRCSASVEPTKPAPPVTSTVVGVIGRPRRTCVEPAGLECHERRSRRRSSFPRDDHELLADEPPERRAAHEESHQERVLRNAAL